MKLRSCRDRGSDDGRSLATPEPDGKADGIQVRDPETFTYVTFGEVPIRSTRPGTTRALAMPSSMNIYDQLVTYEGADASKFVPELAESWEVSATMASTYVFKIREGVKFHEGQDLTASDVAYSFQRGVLQGGGCSPQWLYTEALFGTGIYDIA